MNIKTILNTRLPSLFQELDLDLGQVSLVCQYIELLLKVNKRISLTQANDLEKWYIAHIEDSLRAYSFFKGLEGDAFIDSGSGNGLPGVIFGILSGKNFILCDTDKRKAEFLKTVCYRLSLSGEVYAGPIQDLTKAFDKKHTFVYRGLGPDEILLNQFKLANPCANHFRFISEEQDSLFKGSTRVFYELSDKSQRFLEVFQGK